MLKLKEEIPEPGEGTGVAVLPETLAIRPECEKPPVTRPPSPRPTRYERALESAPHLLDQLREANKENPLTLKNEIGTARMMLGEVMRGLARAHTESGGQLGLKSMQLIQNQLQLVQSLIGTEAGIRARDKEQVLDATKVALLMAALRDDLIRSVGAEAGLPAAVPFINAAFQRARWTGDINPETLENALQAPAEYDVQFRLLEQVGEKDGVAKVIEGSKVGQPAELVVGGGDPKQAEAARLLLELEEAESNLAQETEISLDSIEEEDNEVDSPPPSAKSEGNGKTHDGNGDGVHE